MSMKLLVNRDEIITKYAFGADKKAFFVDRVI